MVPDNWSWVNQSINQRFILRRFGFCSILSDRVVWEEGAMPVIQVDTVPLEAFHDGATYQTLVGDDVCQWRSKKGPPWRCKKGPLGGCGLVP